MERNDRTRRTGIGVFVQNHRRFFFGGITAQHAAGNKLVHAQVGLVQPHTAQLFRADRHVADMAADLLGHHRAHFLEHLAAFLAEELVALADAALITPVEKTEIIADVVREFGLQAGAENFPLIVRAGVAFCFQHQRRGHVTKNKMAVAVFPGQVAGTDFRVHHHHAAGVAGADRIAGGLQAEGGGRAGHVHVVTPAAFHAEVMLDLDRHGRVRALHVGTGHQNRIHIGRRTAGIVQRLLDRLHGHLGLHRHLVVGALGNTRCHALGVQHALFVEHVALLDAGGFLDEFCTGRLQRNPFAGLDLSGMFGVIELDITVERGHQLVVADGQCRRPQSGAADHYCLLCH